MDEARRPDPDVLLERLREEAEREKRGKLKVFFGFAPGVGKTYRMLRVARDLRGHGTDLVIGAVETHGRAETAALIEGLEVIPRRMVEYRGRTLDELDVDAIVARKPKLVLVDELAHTNAPGSRHAKRWQDVVELLEAGIDVHTTLNVQHVESLNDVVSQITHVKVRETVPDSVLDRADEIELVDIAPEELLARLREGKVYLPEQAARAIERFFRRGNLLALRELALRRTAEHVDEDVREYREREGVSTTWPAGERILVCVGPAPASGRLVRATRRMAAGLRAEWIAAYVESPTMPLSDADRERLEAHLRLAQSLGATVTRLTGNRVGEAILEHARRQNVSRLVVGKPTHSRLRDLVRGSLLDEIVRGSGEIDVHVISGDPDEPVDRRPRTVPPPSPTSWPTYGWASLLIAGTTGLALAIQRVAPVPDLEMLYLVAIMIAASLFGRGPSLFAAALSVAAYDFFFVPPFLRFAVEDAHYLLTFAMMFVLGGVVSTMTIRLRRQEMDARGREERTQALYALTHDLGAATNEAEVARVAAKHAAESFRAGVVVLLRTGANGLAPAGASPPSAALDPADLGVAKWVLEHGRVAGFGTDTLPGSKVLCAPLRTTGDAVGALALAASGREPWTLDERTFLETCCTQIGFAIERARLAEDARATALRAKAEEMRSSLLSAVSHDLRTPLATITGAATTLRDEATRISSEQRADLLEAICEEAERLARLVGNLLDMMKVDAGGLRPRREWVPLEEIVGSALTRLDSILRERPIEVRLPPELPLLSVDPVLVEQVFVNVLENAAKYTPSGSEIDVEAWRAPASEEVVVEIRDRGPGIPAGAESRIFEKFHRGAHGGIPGAGLGLAICRGIMEAHGGTIEAANREGSGAVFRLRFPQPEEAPVVSDAQDGSQEPEVRP